jgi:hypothetical protein
LNCTQLNLIFTTERETRRELSTVRPESRGALKTTVRRSNRHHLRMLNELKTAITAFISNISQEDLQQVFTNKIKRVQACIDARGHHFQHLL